IDSKTGQIDIQKTLDMGFFDKDPSQTNSYKRVTIKYTIDDRSSRVSNEIDILMYYYHTMNDVPKNVGEVMQAHQRMTLGYQNLPTIATTSNIIDNSLSNDLLSKPRPPCVIIVGN